MIPNRIKVFTKFSCGGINIFILVQISGRVLSIIVLIVILIVPVLFIKNNCWIESIKGVMVWISWILLFVFGHSSWIIQWGHWIKCYLYSFWLHLWHFNEVFESYKCNWSFNGAHLYSRLWYIKCSSGVRFSKASRR